MNCFRLVFRFDASLPTAERNALLEDFLRDGIEANGLQFGGGGANVWGGYAESGAEEEDEISEAQRRGVIEWLAAEPRVLDYTAGDLFDVELIDGALLGKLEAAAEALEAGLPGAEVDRLLDELGNES